ncbi:MAG: Cys-tRNA(Pro) deacylase [Chromatiales bacterium]|jgi:Cys-tRNA(Pro)/Cys-tRNA(Cys) deacylase
MTPAIAQAKRAGIDFQTHQYTHDPNHPSYGEEAAQKLGVDPARVFKTLVISLDGRRLAVAVVPVVSKLDLKAAAKALGGKRAVMAEALEVERSTGYVLGGVSPLGQKRRLSTLIDDSAQAYQTLFVSAGRRGLEIELAPQDLQRLLDGIFAPLTRSGA